MRVYTSQCLSVAAVATAAVFHFLALACVRLHSFSVYSTLLQSPLGCSRTPRVHQSRFFSRHLFSQHRLFVCLFTLAFFFSSCLDINCRPLFFLSSSSLSSYHHTMREIIHVQAGQCGNQIGSKVSANMISFDLIDCTIDLPGSNQSECYLSLLLFRPLSSNKKEFAVNRMKK